MKVVKSSDMPWADALSKGRYGQRRKPLGGENISCGLWELAPGKKSFPMHRHHVTEEALFVMSGTASVRTPEGLTPVGPGDYVSFPAGGLAHQLINDGAVPFVYLAMGAPKGVDIIEYPDTGKIATVVGTVGSGPGKRHIFKQASQVEYFTDDVDAEG